MENNLRDIPKEFEDELSTLLNKYSIENSSNTPDFILTKYLISCLRSFEETSNSREKWYGKTLHI